jgi:hypothetical protein
VLANFLRDAKQKLLSIVTVLAEGSQIFLAVQNKSCAKSRICKSAYKLFLAVKTNAAEGKPSAALPIRSCPIKLQVITAKFDTASNLFIYCILRLTY